MNRTRMVIKNTGWELASYLVLILCGLLAPRFIILIYGSEVNGLSSTITQILNVLLILQAGASTAAVFSLYQPIASKDDEEISRCVSAAERFFRRISILFALFMVGAAVLTAFFIKSDLKTAYIFIAFVAMGMKNFLDLYFTAKFAVVFTAFQEKYIVSIGTMIEQVFYYTFVFLTLRFRLHFLFLYLWLFLSGVVKVLYLRHTYRKRYGKKIRKYEGKDPGRIRGRTYSLASEVSQSVAASSVAIILSFMYGLQETSVYSVYALVAQALNLVSTALYSAFAPSFGNLVAAEDRETAGRVFRLFQFVFVMVNTVLYSCMLFLLVPFVRMYTSGAKDIDYVNRSLACVIVLSGLFSAYRIPYNVIVTSCGYFKETWLQPVVCVFISIAVSCIGVRFSYTLILLGPVVFYLINFLYQHFRLKGLEPDLVSGRAFVMFAISMAGYALTAWAVYRIPVPGGILPWCCAAAAAAAASALYVSAASRLLLPDEMKQAVSYGWTLLKKRR